MYHPTESGVFIHPQALCESSDVGDGTRVWAFSQVMFGAVIGRECNICGHVFVEAGARIGDRVTVKNGAMIWQGITIENDVFIGPGVLFTNDRYPRSRRAAGSARRYGHLENWLAPTVVRKYASIGAGAVILPGITIGDHSVIGAGALVTRDVASHRLVAGNPARDRGWACQCAHPLDADLVCRFCGARFEHAGNGIRKLP